MELGCNKSFLFITPFSIIPPFDGGKLCMYHRINSFAKKFNVRVIMLNSNNLTRDYEVSKNYFSRVKDIRIIPRVSDSVNKSSYIKKFVQIFKWYKSGKPRAAQTLTSEEYKEKITQYIIYNKVNTVILEMPYASEIIDFKRLKNNNVNIIIVVHGIEHLYFKEAFNLPKFILEYESNRCEKYELRVLKHANLIIGISPWDVNYLKDKYNFKNIYYIPTFIPNSDINWSNNAESEYIVFCGSLSFYPNFQGVEWFLKNIFIKYIDMYPKIKLKITGNVDEKTINNFKKYPNVEFTGYLSNKNLQLIISNCLYVIVPILKGSGTKIKVLESLSYGIPTVTTNHGAQGIPYEGEVPYLVGRNEEEFLAHMINLTNCNDIRKSLGKRAKNFFEKTYASNDNEKEWFSHIMLENSK